MTYTENLTKLKRDGLSNTKIAAQLGVSLSKIKRDCVKYGLQSPPKTALLKNRDWLYDQYVVQNKGIVQIAKELGCGDSSVSNWLRKHDISTHITKEQITKYIVDLRMSVTETSKALGKSRGAVNRAMVKYGVKLPHREILEDTALLKSIYESKSASQIAEEIGVSKPTVLKALHKLGVVRELSISESSKLKLQSKDWLQNECNTKSLRCIAKELDCSQGTVHRYVQQHGIINRDVSKPSAGEYEISEFITKLGFEIERSNRQLISPLELDIYIPAKNIAIEYNGLYWHSNQHKKNNYHSNKRKICESVGIRLIQIFEDDWVHRQEIVKKMLAHKLGVSGSSRVYARKCKIVQCCVKSFLQSNHIQGPAPQTISYALSHNDQIVAACSFRLVKDTTYELVRFATSCTVAGAASKLISKFIKDHQHCTNLISFADLSVSNGELYETLGFTKLYELPPDYKYIITDKRVHKFRYRKSKFKNDPSLLYEEGLTEFQLAELNGINRIYDSGKIKYVLNLTS